jgi:4'-phosphopantetheinyl transferase EntD
MNGSTPHARLIRGLCPPGVVVVAGRGRVGGELLPEEIPAVDGALDTRKRQFTQGRVYAREALRILGASPVAIPMRPDRSPVWPPGVVGAISHTRGLVVAAVAWDRTVYSLGIDVESRHRPLSDRLDRRIRTSREQESQNVPPALDPLRLVFSAKEAIHKCVFPGCGVTLGFLDVELDFDYKNCTFTARLLREREGLPDFRKIVGRYAVTRRFVLTAAAIPAGPGTAPVLPNSQPVETSKIDSL